MDENWADRALSQGLLNDVDRPVDLRVGDSVEGVLVGRLQSLFGSCAQGNECSLARFGSYRNVEIGEG